jgi:hypothetical protein
MLYVSTVIGANPLIDPNFWLPGNPGYSHIYRWGTLDEDGTGNKYPECEQSGWKRVSLSMW